MSSVLASDAATEPVRHEVVVALPLAQAFELFTAHLSRWWPQGSHSCSNDRHARVVFPSQPGQPVLEIAPGGEQHVWGHLTAWDPPHAFAMTWHPGHDARLATQLEVRFSARGASACAVQVVHGGWQSRPDAREGYLRGWPVVLQGLVAAARPGAAAATP